MKRVELVYLLLKNFKGIKEFEINARGKNLEIKGDNGSGKTTIFDGYNWLLFGKDSQNKTDFEIKALDQNGKVKQHGLDHEVTATFRLLDLESGVVKEIELKRVFSEKWTKKKGSANKVFSGHTTKYFVDSVPVKKKDFDETVNSIASEDIFKLLSNPLYFNEQLTWQKRRELLLDISGNVTDQEVAKNSKDLEEFVYRLNGRNVDDYKKIINGQRKEINEELEKIPVRIDEIQFSMPDIDEKHKDDLEEELKFVQYQIDQEREKIAEIKNGAAIMEKKKELTEIEMELANIRNNHDQESKKQVSDIKAEIYDKKARLQSLESDVKNKEMKIDFNNSRMFEINNTIQDLRNEWTEINSKEFKHEADCTCPTCGQDLPEEQIDQAREKAEKSFNLKKSEKLESITQKGKNQAEKVTMMEEENEKLKSDIEETKEEIQLVLAKISQLQTKKEGLESNLSDITENTLYVAKLNEKEQVEKEITQLRESVVESIAIHQEKIEKLEQDRKGTEGDLSKIEQAKRYEKRIEELQQQEKDLAVRFEELEKEIYLSEEFTRKKVDLLEEKINSKFKLAKFKLFAEQINGGIKETCETMYDGVPFDRGLNSAMKINIGIDIISTLQEHYGIRVPIFIDNRESVVKLAEIETQVISLTVSGEHQALTIVDDEAEETKTA